MGFLLTKKRMGDIWKNPVDRRQLLIFSVFGMLSCQYTYFAAIQYSNAGTATVLQSLAPLLILGVVCFKEKRWPRKMETGAIFCALLGVFLLSTHGDIHSMSITTLALVFGLGAAAGGAAYNLLSGDLLRHYGVYAVVGYAMLLAGVAMLPFVRPWSYAVPFDQGTVLATAGVVVIGTAIAFSLYLKGVSIVGPFMGSLLGMMEPITAVIVSLLFLHGKIPRHRPDWLCADSGDSGGAFLAIEITKKTGIPWFLQKPRYICVQRNFVIKLCIGKFLSEGYGNR